MAENSGARFRAPTAREGLPPSTRLTRGRPHSPFWWRLVRVREGSSRQTLKRNGRGKPHLRTLIATLAAIAGLVGVPTAYSQSARSLVRQGNEAYQKEEYSNALESYEKAAEQAPDSPRIWFNRGSALYKEGQYDKAMGAFEQAALSSDDAMIEALSKFSQGNTSFRKGVARQETDPRQALASVETGVRLYQDALKVNPGLHDARHNIEVARRTIERLMEQLKNQPPSPSQGQQKNQNQGQDQQDQNQQQDASEQLKDQIEKQKDAAEQSESAARQQKSDPDFQQMERKAEDLANRQKQLQDETEKLAEKMNSQQQQQQSSPGEQAQENLEQAAQKQAKAEQQLKDQKFDEAQASQKEAQNDLGKALQAMNGKPAGQEQQDQSQQTARNQPASNEQQQPMQQAAEDILNKEKADRQRRQTGIAIRIVPVDKDW